MSKIFISHSSDDSSLVTKLNTFLTSVGIKNEDIFCSSLNGQGVENGKRINSTIQNKIRECELIVFVITSNFLKSSYCTSELGAGWALCDEKHDLFIFKSEDVSYDELNGFLSNDFKCSSFNSDGLSEFYDKLNEHFDMANKHSIINNAIGSFLVEAKKNITILKEDKDKSEKELSEQKIKNLEAQYSRLSPGAKRILGEIYFSYDGVVYYSLSNGIIGLLQQQLFVIRTTSISTGWQQFAFALQPWVKNFIDRDVKIQKELKTILSKPDEGYDPDGF